MQFNPLTTFVSWMRRIECAGDAWAAKRLTPEEYQEALALDAELKRNFWRWLGCYAAIVAVVTLAIGLIATRMGWLGAIVTANGLVICVLLAWVSVWYGYRRYTGPRARKTFAYFVLSLLAGGAVGAIMATLDSGKPITSMSPEKIMKTVGAVLAAGALLVTVFWGTAHLRNRDVKQRVALLEADAERERMARQGVQAELKLLQAQVEPHFLFNTLANVRYLVQVNSPDALAMLDHLIHYLRNALPEIRSDGSTLGREVELARAYLEIMRLRMGGALEVAIDVPAPLTHAPFPALMLMTLVENAIKHGVAPVGHGRVAIRARAVDGRLRVEVDDDGRGLAEPIGRGVGLANVRERLAALYGATARLDLEGRGGGGMRAVIEVPE